MTHIFTFLQRPIVIKLCGGILVFLLITGLRSAGHLEFLELTAYDLFIRLEPKLSAEDSRITLILISEKDIPFGAFNLYLSCIIFEPTACMARKTAKMKIAKITMFGQHQTVFP